MRFTSLVGSTLVLLLAVASCGGGSGDTSPPDGSADLGRPDLGAGDAGGADAGSDAACPDADGDGHRASSCGGDDCDDADPQRYPGRTEVCDAAGHDDDCNPATLGPDADGDGFPATTCCNRQPSGSVLCGADCNDASMDISPTAPESCDGVDDDCDGIVDDGLPAADYTPDCDGDGYGSNAATPMHLCSVPAAAPACALGAWVTRAGDCDDADAARHPGVVETCSGIDANCDGVADPGPDTDGDGHRSLACGGDDCDDADASRYPGRSETCDAAGHDDDCNPATLGPDLDGDGFVAASCCNSQPAGALLCGTDCDDTQMAIHPGAPELCNGIDDDCNGAVDDGLATTVTEIGSVVTPTASAAPMPMLGGGTIVDGTYVLTSVVDYATSTPSTVTHRETWSITGTRVERVVSTGGGADAVSVGFLSTSTFMSTGMMSLDVRCPAAGTLSAYYDATTTTLRVYLVGGSFGVANEVFVYTRM